MATNNLLPEFTPTSIQANTSYQISTEILITANVNFPENVTLYFTGGKITGNGYTLMANNTKIIAGIAHIFDANLNFTGMWIMDRAYPQWFGAKNTYNYNIPDISLDATHAINKAIEIKRVGEVFIPRGEYLIAGTILMTIGVLLKGEKAYTWTDTDIKPNPGLNGYAYQGTILRSNKGGNVSNYIREYMFLLNVNPNYPSSGNEWLIEWPDIHTEIKDIYFYNDNVVNLKCIYSHGGFSVEYCRWKNFAQAIGTTNRYADVKTINHCNASNYIAHTKQAYMFDLNQGEALNFKSVITDFRNNYTKGVLRVNLCNGGVISHCILNDSVLIQDSKGITFISNHLEGKKTQMTVFRSIIDISNNFFEKGCFPTLRADGDDTGEFTRSVVILSNNFFGYYGDDTRENYKPLGISSFDIMTNGYAVIKINNSFRYWVLRGSINKINPFGLKFCQSKDQTYPSPIPPGYDPDIQDNLTEITNFNEYTYLLSIQGEMRPYNSMTLNNSLLIPKNLSASWCGRYSSIVWRLTTDATPTYRAQVILDKKRKIIGNNIINFIVGNDPNKTRRGEAVMFTIGGIADNGYNCIIRLERTFKGVKMICDIPTCSAIHIYDNGEDVNGYKWEPGVLFDGNKLLQSIQFSGNNIICKGTNYPTVGTWTDGDIIYNMGNGTNALWIRQNGTWVAK